MKQIFKKAIETILYGGEVNMIIYVHFKEFYEEVGHTPRNSPKIKFEEFIRFCKKGGLTRKPFFSFPNSEMKKIEAMKSVSEIEIFRADFDWAKTNACERDLRGRVEEIEKAGVSDSMFGGDEVKIKIVRDIMNDPKIKYKSDKIKALLKEEFSDTQVHEIMNKREDMVCTLSYIANIHKGLLDGTIK